MRKWLLALVGLAGMAAAQGFRPPEHTQRAPLYGGLDDRGALEAANLGTQVERDRDARFALAEHRRLTAVLAAMQPQRKGVVDAYVVVAGLDSDPVFGREAREAGRVLARRYGAEGRTIVLAGTDGRADSALPMGSPAHLSIALARVAELMDPKEDVLVLYTTSHGAPFGIVYQDADAGVGAISPSRLWGELSTLGIRNRLILISACYSGVFVPMLSSDTTAIITASSAQRSSFGCVSDNDWTFFGDALVNRALRSPQPLDAAVKEADGLIAGWETQARLKPSQPQVSIGGGAHKWLAAIERRLPAASPPVGRPAIDALDK